MAKKFATNIDLLLNELQNAKIHIVASDPGGPVEGQIYYNSTSKALKFYNGSAWVALGYLNQMTATGAISVNNQLISSLATPISDTDAATKGYVDSVAQGLDAKPSCVVATTANITLSGAQTIDGIAVVAGDRVLVKDQTTTNQNGIYVVASGAWARSTDCNTWTELVGAFTFVEKGTAWADTGWLCSVDAGGTLGTTAVTFVQFSAAGQISAAAYTTTGVGTQASITPTKTGNVFYFKNLSTPTNQGAVTVSNGASNDVSIAVSAKIEALHDQASSGIIVQTGAATWAARTVTAGNDISVTDGNGVSGNPTIAVNPTTLHDSRGISKYASLTFAFVSNGTDIALAHNLALPTSPYTQLNIQVFETASWTEVEVDRSTTAWTANTAYIKMTGGTTGAGYYTAVITG